MLQIQRLNSTLQVPMLNVSKNSWIEIKKTAWVYFIMDMAEVKKQGLSLTISGENGFGFNTFNGSQEIESSLTIRGREQQSSRTFFNTCNTLMSFTRMPKSSKLLALSCKTNDQLGYFQYVSTAFVHPENGKFFFFPLFLREVYKVDNLPLNLKT